MKAHQHVGAQGQLAVFARGPVGDDVPGPHLLADVHQRTLVDRGVLVGAVELAQPVNDPSRASWRTARPSRALLLVDPQHDPRGSTLSTTPPRRAITTVPLSRATRSSRPVLTTGASGLKQRHGLALHVGAHQRAVGVIVLQERDQRRGDLDYLLRRHVHVLDFCPARSAGNRSSGGKGSGRACPSVFIERVLAWAMMYLSSLEGVHVADVFGHPALLHLAVRGLDEPEDR